MKKYTASLILGIIITFSLASPSMAAYFYTETAFIGNDGYTYVPIGLDTEGQDILSVDMLGNTDPEIVDIKRIIDHKDDIAKDLNWTEDFGMIHANYQSPGNFYSAHAIYAGGPRFNGRGILSALVLDVKQEKAFSINFVCEDNSTTESNITGRNDDTDEIIDFIDCSKNESLEYTLPITTPAPKDCSLKGDHNCDGKISLGDFEIWRQRYIAGEESLAGFEVFRQAYTTPVVSN